MNKNIKLIKTLIEGEARFSNNDVNRQLETPRFAAFRFMKMVEGIVRTLQIEDGDNIRANEAQEYANKLVIGIDPNHKANTKKRYQCRNIDINLDQSR